MKKGYVLTLDAILALILVMTIFLIVLGIQSSIKSTEKTEFKRIHYISEDAIEVLNKRGVLDQICTEWALADNNESSPHWINAGNIAREYLSEIIPDRMGYKLLIDGKEICNDTRIPENEAMVKTHSTRILTGYMPRMPVIGCVSRSYLVKIASICTEKTIFFEHLEGAGSGGYNTAYVKKTFNLPDDAVILDGRLYMWLHYNHSGGVGGYIVNGVDSGWKKLCDVQPGEFDITNDLKGGNNSVTVYFHEDTWEVLDTGFVNVKYSTSTMPPMPSEVIRVPLGELRAGQDHMSNMFNFYVPGDLASLKFHFHLINATNENFTLRFNTMKMGNRFEKTKKITGDDVIIEFNDTDFTGINYDDLEETTIVCYFLNICVHGSNKYVYVANDSYIEFIHTPKNSIGYGDLILESSTRFDYDHGAVDNIICGKPKYEWIEARYYIPDGAIPMEVKAAFAEDGWEQNISVWADDEPVGAHLVWDQSVLNRSGQAEIGYWVPTEFIKAGRWNHIRIYRDNYSCCLEPQSILSYKFAIKPMVPYGDVFPECGGGYTVAIYYDRDYDGSQDGAINISIAEGGTLKDINELDPEENAVDDSLLRLLDKLNFVNDTNEGSYGTNPDEYDGSINNPIDIVPTPEIISESTRVGRIRSLWGPVEVKLVVWMK